MYANKLNEFKRILTNYYSLTLEEKVRVYESTRDNLKSLIDNTRRQFDSERFTEYDDLVNPLKSEILTHQKVILESRSLLISKVDEYYTIKKNELENNQREEIEKKLEPLHEITQLQQELEELVEPILRDSETLNNIKYEDYVIDLSKQKLSWIKNNLEDLINKVKDNEVKESKLKKGYKKLKTIKNLYLRGLIMFIISLGIMYQISASIILFILIYNIIKMKSRQEIELKDCIIYKSIIETDLTSLKEEYSVEEVITEEEIKQKIVEYFISDRVKPIIQDTLDSISAKIKRIKELQAKVNSISYDELHKAWADRREEQEREIFPYFLSNFKKFEEDAHNDLITYKNSLKPFYMIQEDSYVMSNKAYYQKDKLADYPIQKGDINFIFGYSNEPVSKIFDYTANTIINFLISTRPRNCIVTISDPVNKGGYLSAFINEKTQEYISFNHDIGNVIKEMGEVSVANQRILQGKTISEYNKEAQEGGFNPIPYRVYMLLSGCEEEISRSLKDYIVTLRQFGIIIEVFIDRRKEQREPISNMTDFASIYNLENYCTITQNELYTFVESFGFRLDATKQKGVLFIDSLKAYKEYSKLQLEKQKSYISEKEYKDLKDYRLFLDTWHTKTDKFTILPIGFENGDKRKPIFARLGLTGDVHMMIAGTTGSGKSVLNNNNLIGACNIHSPEDLRLVLIDCKGAEGAIYMKSDSLPYQLPHADTIVCSSDIQYIAETLEYYVQLMKERNDLIGKFAVKDVLTWNEAVERGDIKGYPKMPAILIAVDEFAVILKDTSENKSRCIAAMQQIVNVARTVRFNLCLLTQNFGGSMPAELQSEISARIALRVQDKAVSNMLIGSDLAAQIKENNGYLYFFGAQTKKQPILCKTPFIDDNKVENGKYKFGDKDASELHYRIKELADLAEQKGYKYPTPITYKEKELYHLDQLKGYLQDNPLKDNYTMYIGRMMSFSPKHHLPISISFDPSLKNNTNLMSGFDNIQDAKRFLYTILTNIYAMPEESKVFIKNFNVNLEEPMGLSSFEFRESDKKRYESCKKLNYDEFMNKIIKPLASRIESTNSIPIYVIICGTESEEKFSLSANRMETGQEWLNVMQEASSKNIHFIFITTALDSCIRTKIKERCSIVIAGKVSSNDYSQEIIGTTRAVQEFDLQDSYGFLKLTDKTSQRFKLYQLDEDWSNEVRSLLNSNKKWNE